MVSAFSGAEIDSQLESEIFTGATGQEDKTLSLLHCSAVVQRHKMRIKGVGEANQDIGGSLPLECESRKWAVGWGRAVGAGGVEPKDSSSAGEC